jgi:diacylglycerol kinase family enzyme
MYFVAFCLTLPRFKQRTAHVEAGASVEDVALTNLVVAIGKVFGGGMRVAPNADASDGAFDVQIQTGSKTDYVVGIPKVYKGTHIPHPRISEHRSSTLSITCEPAGLIEADGEVLGKTPAVFRVLPRVLRIKV